MRDNVWAVITGAGTGIGRALALHLAEQGFSILGIGRRLKPLLELARENERIKIVSADVSVEHDRSKILQALPQDAEVRYLVHNAAVLGPVAPLMSIKESDWGNHLAINLNGPLFLTRILLNRMQEGARVLHISSGAAHKPYRGWGAYCTSKAALHMLYQVLDLELRERSIRVGSARPGVVNTAMQDQVREADHNVFPDLPRFHDLKANDQLLDPSEVAVFLAKLLMQVDPDTFARQEWDIREQQP